MNHSYYGTVSQELSGDMALTHLTIIPISFPRLLFSHPKIFMRFLQLPAYSLSRFYSKVAKLIGNSKSDSIRRTS
jgi:hypothetical protein